MSDTGIVVVTYNSEDVIERCLESCRAYETIVVDNASTDGTLETVRRSHARLIANDENRGFAAAVNQGVRALSTDFVVLLNPDVVLETPLDALAAAGPISAGCLLDQDGQPQAGFTVRRFPSPAVLALEVLGLNRLFPRNRANRAYRYLDRDLSAGGPVEQPAGALLGFERKVWDRLNGFDENFHPIWFEDVDFCKRASELGYRIEFVPAVKGRHVGGHSVGKLGWECRERYWYGSLLKYASKHFSRAGYRFLCAAVVLGSAFRAVAGTLRRRSLRPVAVFAGVSGSAARGSRVRQVRVIQIRK